MRLLLTMSLLLALAGCETQPRREVYSYSEPVRIILQGLRQDQDGWVAEFAIHNVSSESMWFDGEKKQLPSYCFQYKKLFFSEPVLSNGLFWGDQGLGRYRLGPGEKSTFRIRRSELSEPFRVGVWLSPEADNKTFPDLIYWSETISP
jgi:hypothetical protein